MPVNYLSSPPTNLEMQTFSIQNYEDFVRKFARPHRVTIFVVKQFQNADFISYYFFVGVQYEDKDQFGEVLPMDACILSEESLLWEDQYPIDCVCDRLCLNIEEDNISYYSLISGLSGTRGKRFLTTRTDATIRNTLITNSSKQIAGILPKLPMFARLCHEKMTARKHKWADVGGTGVEETPGRSLIEAHCQGLLLELMDLFDTEILSSGGITARVKAGELQLVYGRSQGKPRLKLTATKLEDVENGKEIDTKTSSTCREEKIETASQSSSATA